MVGPRDLGNIRDAIKAARLLRDTLAKLKLAGEAVAALEAIVEGIASVSQLTDRLELLLVDEPPYLARDGGFIRAGVHPPLDEVRALRDESRRVIAGLESKYRQDSGVAALKIKHNGVLGYFIEVTGAHADKLLAMKDLFRHRQTMAGAGRFSTDELANLASRIAEAGEQTLALERMLFDEMVALVLDAGDALSQIAGALAVFDVAVALAELSVALRYVRPSIDNGLGFKIARGRHPVVEAALAADHARGFVPNDCDLSPNAKGRLWLVTGPNMAGKSTFPAPECIDRDIGAGGQFRACRQRPYRNRGPALQPRWCGATIWRRGVPPSWWEMVETAAILNQATPKSLVILDEIGRGTATYDGLAIAWAAAEHLHETNKSRALFATHYHEMTALSERLSAMTSVTMKVKEWNDTIVFLHEVVPGMADRSYGIHVAKLAGLPDAVVTRAEEVLKALEDGREGHQPLAHIDDLPLFGASAPAPKVSQVEEMLKKVEPDALSPKEALEMLYDLKRKLSS